MKNILNNIKAEDLLIKRAVNMSPEEILLLSDKLEDIILKNKFRGLKKMKLGEFEIETDELVYVPLMIHL